MSPAQLSRIRNTGVKMELLQTCGAAITALPEGFNAHRQIRKVYEQRRAMVETGALGGVVMWRRRAARGALVCLRRRREEGERGGVSAAWRAAEPFNTDTTNSATTQPPTLSRPLNTTNQHHHQ